MAGPLSSKWRDWEATYRGAASIALGGIPLLMAIPFLLQGRQSLAIAHFHHYGMYGSPPQMVASLFGAILIAATMTTASLFGVVEGIQGRSAAHRTGEPRVLCNAGILFGLLALVLWMSAGYVLAVGIDLLQIR